MSRAEKGCATFSRIIIQYLLNKLTSLSKIARLLGLLKQNWSSSKTIVTLINSLALLSILTSKRQLVLSSSSNYSTFRKASTTGKSLQEIQRPSQYFRAKTIASPSIAKVKFWMTKLQFDWANEFSTQPLPLIISTNLSCHPVKDSNSNRSLDPRPSQASKCQLFLTRAKETVLTR